MINDKLNSHINKISLLRKQTSLNIASYKKNNYKGAIVLRQFVKLSNTKKIIHLLADGDRYIIYLQVSNFSDAALNLIKLTFVDLTAQFTIIKDSVCLSNILLTADMLWFTQKILNRSVVAVEFSNFNDYLFSIKKIIKLESQSDLPMFSLLFSREKNIYVDFSSTLTENKSSGLYSLFDSHESILLECVNLLNNSLTTINCVFSVELQKTANIAAPTHWRF